MIDKKLAEIKERIGPNCGQITINYMESYDGPSVEVKAYVSAYGDNRNIVGPGFGRTVKEAVCDLLDFIGKEEEKSVWPWWADTHSLIAWQRPAEEKWPKQ